MKKKIISTILILAMLLSTAAMLVFPTSLTVSAADTEPYTPAGSKITTIEQLAAMQKGGSYYLGKDLEIDSSWSPKAELDNIVLDGKDENGVVHTINFKNSTKPLIYSGTNITIKNLNLTGSLTGSSAYYGSVSPLFGATMIYDPKLINITSSVDITLAPLTYTGTAENGISEYDGAGGIAGFVHNKANSTDDLIIENCTYTGTIYVNHQTRAVGGIVGVVDSEKTTSSTARISGCTNKGTVVFHASNTYCVVPSLGGIIGNIYGSGNGITIEDCLNHSEANVNFKRTSWAYVSYNSDSKKYEIKTETDSLWGGIVGRINSTGGHTIRNCVNRMNITDNTNSMWWGGIVGLAERGSVIENCENYGHFSFTKRLRYIGGIVCKLGEGNNTVKNCRNYGDITTSSGISAPAHEAMGGIVAMIKHGSNNSTYAGVAKLTANVMGCLNAGKINLGGDDATATTAQEYYVGGIIGRVYGGEIVNVTGCVNLAEIDGLHRRKTAGTTHTKSDTSEAKADGGQRGAGGIIGGYMTSYGAATLTITDCENKGNVSGKVASGILACVHQLYDTAVGAKKIIIDISYCTNSGTITGIGYGTWDTLKCTFGSGGAKPYGDAGGIVGGMDLDWNNGCKGELYVDNCSNSGTIRGGRFTGGIVGIRSSHTPNGGYSQNGDSFITNCANTGTVQNKAQSEAYPAAGIVGSAKGNWTLQNCVNTGALQQIRECAVHTETKVVAPIIYVSDMDTTRWTTTVTNCYSTVVAVPGSKYPSYTSSAHTYDSAGTTSATMVATVANAVASGAPDVSYTGVTVVVTDCTDFNKYTKGARDFVLGADITVPDSDSYPKDMDGITFDGKGKTVTLPSYTARKLFGRITNSTLKNVTLYRQKGGGHSDALNGPLAGEVGGTMLIENVFSKVCYWEPNRGSNAHGCVGGIVGSLGIDGMTNKITVKDCSTIAFDYNMVSGKLSEDAREVCAGAIAGHVLIGSANDEIVIDNCTNNVPVIGHRVGGIIGGICTNDKYSMQSENVESSKSFQNAKVTITNCTNNGRVMGYAIAGGIIGDATDRTHLLDLRGYNGRYRTNIPYAQVTVTKCLNTAPVCSIGRPTHNGVSNSNATTTSAGGIVSISNGNITISDCINKGQVMNTESAVYVGDNFYYGVTNITTDKDGNVTGQSGGVSDRNGYNYYDNNPAALNHEKSYLATGRMRCAGGILGMKPEQSSPNTDGDTGVLIKNCKNMGDVIGANVGIGGIAGYAWMGHLTIKSCVNTGRVLSAGSGANVAYASAGILGQVGSWGNSKWEGGTMFWAYDEIDPNNSNSKYKINVDGCINAGLVELTVAAHRDADVWKMACGIVGPCTTGIRIANCAHVGQLEDNADWWNSTFPITNSVEMKWGFPHYHEDDWQLRDNPNNLTEEQVKALCWNIPAKLPTELHKCENNYYAATSVIGRTWDEETNTFIGVSSVDNVLITSTAPNTAYNEINHHYGEYLYKFSSEASDEQIKMIINRADVYAFDRQAFLKEQVEFANWIKDPAGVVDGKWRGLEYTDAQKATINAEIAESEALMAKTDATDIWGRQNEVYIQEQELRDAIMAYSSTPSYTVYIPEQIPTNSEVILTATLKNFAYYDGLKVTMNSASGNKLAYEDDPTVTIDYKAWYDGEDEAGSVGYLMFSQELKSLYEIMADPKGQLVYNATGEDAMKRSMILIVDKETNKDKPEGIYKDEVTFTVEKISLENQ